MDDNDAVDEVRLLTDGDGINDEVTLLMDGNEIIDDGNTNPKGREANGKTLSDAEPDEVTLDDAEPKEVTLDDGGKIIDEVTLLMDGNEIIDDGGGKRAAR